MNKQVVTREEEKKKRSSTDYLRESISFWSVDGVLNNSVDGNTVIFKGFLLQSLLYSLASMFLHFRKGVYWLAAGMKLL